MLKILLDLIVNYLLQTQYSVLQLNDKNNYGLLTLIAHCTNRVKFIVDVVQ